MVCDYAAQYACLVVFGADGCRIPFYSLVKTIILLAMSLPQTEASTYVYRNHLAPLFAQNEGDIDVFLAGLRGQAADVISGGAVWLWGKIREQLAVSSQLADQTSDEGRTTGRVLN